MLLLILRYFIFHMIKRFLTFALSVGFFIWLPNAFADGSGVLSLDAPSHIRQTQNNHKDLLTLRVDNIQVRAGWEVTDADSVFTIKAESNAGVLQTVKTIVAPVIHVATIYVEDKFELLNPSYANLTASAVITVEFKSGAADKLGLGLKDAPRLTAVAGKAVSLHTFAAEGGSGDKTYTLVGGDDADYFDLDKNSGVLSLLASAQAGVYTLTVEVRDDAGDTDKALAMVEVSAALELAEVSSFTVIANMAMSLRTFIASGGIGTPTYTILAGNEKEGFTLNAASGVLSLVADAKPDNYVLRIQAMDARDNTAETVVTVGVSAVLSLADAQRLGGAQGTAISLHIFAAQGGIGARTYTLLTDDVEDYFSLDAESGVLSLLVSATMGTYTLSVEVRDSRGNVADALATVRVAFLYLADAPPLYAVVGREVSLHTFAAKGVIGTATYAITLDNDKNYFSIDAESGVLSVRANAAIGIYTLSVSVKDGHSDAEALAVALVEVRASLSLATVPPLTVIAGGVAHTLAASGGIGTLTYTIAPGNEVGFAVDAASGVLSLSVNAEAGRHTLTLQVADARANTVQALATVEVPAVLVLSDAPSFTVIASVAMSLHTFIASGGIGIKTYTLVAGDAEKYFSVDAASGVFSLSLSTPAKDYMLTVRVMDGRDNTADTVVTVEVSAALVLAAAPSFTVIASVAMSLHTFIASGGIGAPTYTILAGNEGRDFTLNAASGVLSLSMNAKTGEYTLTVQVMDARNNAVQVVATVGVSAALELAEVSSFTVIASVGMNLHTFIASGGIGAPTYTILAGNEGRDFTLNAASGVLSLSVNAELGSHTLTVQVMDERANTAQAVATVEVSAVLSLAAAPSFTVIASVAMSLHTFIASGGIGTPTYTIVSGNEGRDFTLNAASGVLSLSVNAKTGEYTLTVQVMDARNNAVQVVATVGVSAALELAEVSSFTVIASVGMNLHTFIASGGIGAPTYTILAGNEGRDFTLNAASGVLSLSVNAELGSHTLTVQVMDERANTAQAVATVEVSAALALAAAPSFTVIASVAMSLHTFIASGGIGTPTYTIVSGNEGRDFTLNAASGVLSLSVNAKTGEYTLTVQVMDERANTAQAVATVEVSAALALAAVPSFTVIASVGMNLHTLVANGGIGTPTYTIVAGNDDGQFTLNAASGVLSLVADAKPDNYVLRIQAMDARANTAQAMVTVGVSAVLSLADAQRLGGAQGIAISLHTFAAQGGIGARTYTLLTDDVKDYFSLGAESGVLSLLASVTVGTYTLSVEVRDSRGNVADALATVRVAFLFLADAPPLYAVVGREVSLHTFDAKGVVGTLTYTITAGDDKDYFSLDAESGALSVRATAAIGVYTLLVSVKDSRSDAKALAVVEVRASLSLVAMPPLTVIAGRVAHTLAASGGIGDLTYVIVSGKDGFALDANGVLSLHADAGLGRHTLTLQVMDERKHTVQALATVEVSAVLVLSDAPSFTVIASVAMSLHTFIASGGIGIKTYTLVAGDAEKYFAVDAASGVFSLSLNTPAKDYMLTVRAMDARDNTVETVVMVGVSAVLALAATPSFTVIASVGMNLHRFIASGGIGAPTYTILAGNEGRDFTLNAASGVLSLSVNAELGSYTLTVQVMDERANTADTVVTVEVSAALVLAAAPSFTVIASVAMSLHTFIASGGIGTPTYTIVAGNEGRDFTLNAASGVLSLSVNAEVGRHTLTVQVLDARNNTVETVVTVGVSAVLELAATPSFTVIASVGMNLHTFIASGGIGTPTYTILAGNDDGQFTLNAASGVLSLSVNAELGSYTLTVQVMDGRDNTAQAVATVEVAAALVLAAAPSFTVIASVAMSLHMFIASGGIGTPTYTIVAGNEGRDFTLNAASGVLSLSVNAEVGRYTLTVQVMDERSNTAQAVATVGVSAALTLAATPSFTVIASVAMSLHTFIAGGGIGRKTYTLAAGDERYFSVGADSGVLSLSMNAEAGEYTLTVRVMDEHHNSIVAVVMVGVSAVLALADAPLLRTLVGEAGNLHTFAATGGLGDKTYTLVAGNEDYFNLDRSSGVLSMEVTVSLGMYTLSVQVADAEGNVASALATVKVASLLLRDVMLYAIEGREVSLYTFEAGGGSGAKTYTIVAGNEDRHFTLAANSGVLSVQGSVSVGIYTLSMQVQDAGGDRSEALAVVAVEASLFLADAPSLGALTGITMSVHTFAASGGIGAKIYTLSAGEGQAYFTLNAASGVLSVANATVGVYTLSVKVSDSRGNQVESRGTVEVVGTLSLADAPPLEALARLSVEVTLHTFAAGGGYGAKRYVMIADESGYFAIDAASGELLLPSNSAMLAGAYTLRVGVSDGLTPPQRATAMAAVRITRSGIFVLGGDDSGYKNDVWLWSAGGKVWKQETASASWDARFRHQAVAYHGRLYVLGGGQDFYKTNTFKKGVWSSADGKNWVSESTPGWSERISHQAVEYQGRLYVMGGRRKLLVAGKFYLSIGQDVWSWANGESWREDAGADWPIRYSHQAVVHNGRLYVLGGRASHTIIRNDVWSWAEGENKWSFEGNAPWEARYEHQAVSHMGRLYVLGGQTDTGGPTNDVWSSLDGKNWRQETAAAAWSKRNGHQVVSRDGRLYLMGGYSGSDSNKKKEKDVWTSVDGKSWSLANPANAGWSARDHHQAVVFPPNLVLSGTSATIILTLQAGLEIYTVSAQYGGGQYTYSLPPEIEGFKIDESSGVLSADNQAQAGVHEITVRVEDEEGSHAETIINIELPVLALATVPPLTVIAGRVAHTLAASGGVGTHTYAMVPGNEVGFALDAASGVLSLSVNAKAGRHTLTLQVADARANTVQAVATVEVSAVLVLSEVPSFTVIASVAMSLHTFIASGGIGIKTYTLVAGDAGEYFAVDATSGVFSLSLNTPAKDYMLTVRAMDARDNTVETVVTVGVSAALELAAAPSFTVIASVGMNLHTFVASGGIGAPTYTILAGNEGKDFTLNATSGVLSLSVNAKTGEYTLTVQVMDGRANTADTVVTVEVSAALVLAESPSFTVIASVGMNLHTFIASGGIGTPTYTIVSGNEGGHFALDAASGVLSLTVDAAVGRYTLTVRVMDERDNAVQVVAMVGVSAVLALAESPSFTVIASVGMNLHTFVASGGIGTPTYTMVSGNEGKDFTLNAASGVLSLSVNAEVGSHTLTVQVMDERDNIAETVVTVEVSAALVLAAAPSFTVIASVGMNLHMFIASGGIGTPTYTIVSGNEGGYFALDAASGVLSLTVDAAVGRYTLTVRVMDERDNAVQVVAMVGVSAVLELAAAPSFTVITVGMNLHTFIASGGIGTPTYTILAGNEGRDFTLNAASGVLSLSMNAEVGSHTLTVQVMDERDNTAETVVTVEVAALILAAAPSFTVIASVAMSLHTFIVSGGIGLTYTILAGNEGRDFTLNAASGVLSLLMNAEVGRHTLTVQVMDERDNAAQVVVMVGVSAVLELAAVPSFTVIASVAMSLHTFIANGGIGTPTYTIVAGNDDGHFVLNAASGVLSLTVDAAVGSHTLTVQVMDARDNTAQAVATVEVSAALVLAKVPSFAVIASVAMSLHTFIASGGIGTPTYTIVAGNDDGYFVLNAASGVLSLTVDAAVGVYTLSVQVSDSRGNQVEARGTVEVVGVLSLADAPPLEALARLSVPVTLHTFVASGGYGAKRYTLIADEAGYFAIDANSGELSLPKNSAMLAGEYTLRVGVLDGLTPPQRATATAAVRIARSGIFVLGGASNSGYKNDAWWWSAGGNAWKRETASAGWSARLNHQAVAYHGRLYVMGGDSRGYLRDVWSSADGKNWVSESEPGWGKKSNHQAVEYQGRLYVMGGLNRRGLAQNDVWSWANGESWRRDGTASWPARYDYQAVVHNGRLYVLGGNDGSLNDVWSSADGANWSFEGNADWPGRYQLQVVSHQGRLYVLGGINYNDVWSSLDGKSWRQELANDNDFWNKRAGYQALSRDGLLYVLGGVGGGRKKDVWSSADGRSWTKGTDAAWDARSFHRALVFPPNLVLSGTSKTIILTVQAAVALHTVSAQYGGGRYTYSLTPEIEGFNIVKNSNGDGVLSTDNQVQAGAYTLTVRVDDEEGGRAETIINIEMRFLALADAPPLFAVAGLAESVSLHAFTAIYPIGASTYNLVDDSGYFTLDAASGVLSVSANVSVGVYTLSVVVSDDSGNEVTAVATVEAVPMLSLADAPLLSVVAGKALELHTFIAAGGIKAKTYNLVDAAGYFTLGASSGVLSAQAFSEVGIYTVSVEVSDSVGNQATAQATVGVIARLSLADASLMAVEKKAVSLHTFAASGGIGARTYTLSAGNETGYFVLDASGGVLSLSANASAGAYTLTVEVKDERGNAITAVAAVNISAALSLAGVPQLLFVAEGEAKNLHTFVASGGLGVKTYTVAAGAGYFTIGAASGVLSVDANATVGMYTLSVQAADTDGNVVEALATAQVVSLLLADVMLYAIVGREVSLHTFEAGGGGGAKTYTIVAGNEDRYFRLDANSGVLSVRGSVTVGVYTLSVEVRDAEDNRAEVLAVVAVEASLFLADAPPLTVMAGLAVSLHTFAASGGIGVKAYTITAGNEAKYFTLNAASGVLSLRATAPEGFYTLTVQAADEYDNLAEAVATVDVSVALSLADASLLEAVVGMTMSVHTFSASGGIGAKTYTLVVDNGAGYFAINATSGVLSVASATVGVYTLSVTVSDSRGNSVQARATVQVSPPMSLADAPLLEALARLSVTVVLHTFVASDGIGSKRYTLIADEADYFALDAASGELLLPSNSAMLAGEYILSVAVSDGLMPPQRATAAATVQIARNRIFVLGGSDGSLKDDVWSSADGESWRQDTSNAGWTPRQLHQAVAHNGRLYVLGGADGSKRKDVWSSVDGANWQRETDADWPGREIHQAVSYKGRLYVLGGQVSGGSKRNDVWSSADGVTWRRDKANNTSGWTARDRHQAVVHNGRMYVLGGQVSDGGGGRNDVWSSANGSSWRFEGNADWDARYFHQAVSHAGRLYVLGGSDGGVRSDVWSSVDGRSWVEEKEDNNVSWSKRYRHQSLSRDGLLYVLGGENGGRKKDVWSSADGKTWEPETDAAWTARMFHQALVFPPHLVLSGTSETITLTVGVAAKLHPFSAQYGGGQYTYSLPSEIEGFSIDGAGVLSADNQAQEGGYEITVRVEDEEGGHAETIISIELRVIALADAPPLFAVAGLSESVSLHAFTAIYGIGAPTYNLVDDLGYFTLGDASGVLSVQANVSLGIYTVSVEVSDESGKMATAVATVEAVPMPSLADAPPLTVMAGLAVSLHTFAASDGIGVKTYTIAAGNEAKYFTLNAMSGVLSLRATAPEGFHTLTVQAADEDGNLAEAVATVDVSAALSLAEAPLLEAVVGMTMSVHTFAASGGIGAKTYTLVADNGSGYFAINATSGVLSVVNGGLGVYTLSVQVSDSRGNSVQARATVQVAEVLSLADAPSLEALARLSVMVSLHTFVASDGIGSKRYTIIADESGYFALDAVSGELSLSSNSAMRAGAYALRVEVSDGLMPPQRATAVATVQIARNGIFVLGGNESDTATNDLQNDVWWSVDGGSWRENTSNAGWTARENHQVVAYRGRMYLMGGFEPEPRNDVWSSVDGKNWSLVTDSAGWSARGNHQALVHKGRMYVLGGGDQNDVWSSLDGKNWSLVTDSAGWSGGMAVAHNGRMYMTGGYNRSDVWSSADGSSWRFEGDAAWGPRHLHQAVSHAGRLYVLGGIQGDNSHRRRNDVWSSLDGRSWEEEQANDNDFWTKRDRHQALSRDGLLYVLGGNVGGTNDSLRKDVWSSSDGKSWTQVTMAAGWEAREYHQALAFPPGLALSGTSEMITLTVQAAIYTLSAQYGFGEYTYSLPLESEALGFDIDKSSGVLSADNQAQGGGYEITVRVDDEEGGHAESIINIELRVLALADAPPLSVIAGAESVSLHAFTAIYGIGAPTYNLVDDLGYFTLGDASGVLSVQANVTVGVYTVSVKVSDDSGKMATAVATVEAVPMPSLADAPPLTVMAGLAVSLHTFAASDGIGVKTYTIAAGNEAKYFTLNAASGVLSLRATAPEGLYTLTVQAADEDDNLAEAVATVDVSAALSLAEASLLEAVVGMTMSVHTFAASGGIGAKTYTLVADNGSGYFAINATSGVLSVVNAGLGVYTLSVQVSDSRGSRVQARATVQVAEVLSLADAPSLEALARLSVMVSLHTFVAGDGIGSKRYTIIADEAGYFALDAVSGELSLSSNSAMLAGAYALRVEVSDGLMPPQRATAVATVQIARNGIFVLGGNESDTATNDLQNDVWWSVDGGSWRENTSNAGWTARELHQVVAHRGRMYLLGGVVATGEKSTENRNDVWSSVDGKNWSLVTDSAGWSARGNHQALVHKGRMYVLGGGGQNDVWSSLDGKNWSLVTDSAGWSGGMAVAHNGRMYMTGGYNRSDVWSSADGSSWRFEGDAAWGPRHLHQAVSHAGRLYVLGGIQGDNSHRRRNDVWSSLDGRSWEEEQANDNDFWTKRDRHQALSRDGLLYVLGGNVGGTNDSLRKDVWSSSDGKSWTQVTMAAGWEAREYHQALAFPPGLALSGTSEMITLTVQAAIYTLSAQYGFGEYTYSLPLESEALGFDIDKSSGVLSADNQAQGGGYEITVRVEDEEGGHAESIINIELRVLALADAPPLSVIAGAEAMSLHAFTAIYGIGAPTYNLVDDLGYFTLGDASGVLSVQANVTVGVYTVSVEVSDDSGKMATAVATVEVLPMLSLADAPLLSVVAGKALSLHTFTAAGGSKAKTYNLVDESGFFTLGESSGILSVQAVSEVGIYTVSVEVSDSAGNQATAHATVGVTARLSLADASLMAVEKKAVSLHTFVASGGIGARTYTLSAGNETGYFVLDAASGVLSLSASASAGEYTLTVGVKDERANIATAVATVNISVGLSLADAPPLEALARLSVMVSLHTFVASDGIGSKRYTIIADEAGYFALDAVSGELSLSSNSAMRAGAYALRVEVSDGLMPPQRATAVATVQIARNGIFVLGGNESDTEYNDMQNDVWWSVDGGSWRENTSNAGWTAREFHQVVAHRGRMYLLGGVVATGEKSTENRNDVWSSLDGKNWSLVTGSADWSARGHHQALVHKGRMYVLGGGGKNDVWSSADGENWEEETGSADWTLGLYRAVAHNGRMYVTGGYGRSDVWSSADGSSWRFEGDAAWGPRHFHQAVSHAGRLYVLGGIQGTNSSRRRNDVWSSLDGRSWVEEKVNNNAFWVKRDRYQALSRDGLLYVLGGNGGTNAGLRKDVWSSPDGKSWTQVTMAAGWEAREYHQALAFPPGLALSGTSETITLTVQAAIYTLSAQYGFGEYTYSLPLESEALGFDIDKSSGVLSADGNAAVGGHTLTVQVEDEEGSQAETVVQVEIVAASTAALSAGSSIISPPASGGGASALALAGGGLSLLIITPPASSLARPRTPPHKRGG